MEAVTGGVLLVVPLACATSGLIRYWLETTCGQLSYKGGLSACQCRDGLRRKAGCRGVGRPINGGMHDVRHSRHDKVRCQGFTHRYRGCPVATHPPAQPARQRVRYGTTVLLCYVVRLALFSSFSRRRRHRPLRGHANVADGAGPACWYTYREVERRVVERVRRKAATFGQDVTEHGAAAAASAAGTNGGSAEGGWGPCPSGVGPGPLSAWGRVKSGG